MKKLTLIDGNNLIFRSYFATSYSGAVMTNSKGFPTNAIYSFINMINKIIKEEEPEYILVAFDKGKTFRHEKYKDYKAGRAETPDELKMQFAPAKEVLKAMGITPFEIDMYEADDIIGTLSKEASDSGNFQTYIISSDKDLLQLVDSRTYMKFLKHNDFTIVTPEVFKEKYGVEPIRMIDLKALMGDSSDNIPGVHGIGEKGAIKLLSEYKSLDNLYAHIDEIKGKTKEKLIEDKEKAYASFDLATIYRKVPLPFTIEDIKYKGPQKEKLKKVLTELEFHSLLKKYDLVDDNISSETKESFDTNKIRFVSLNEFNYKKPFSFYIEVDPKGYSKGDILSISFMNDNEFTYVTNNFSNTKDIFESSTLKYTYDLKKAYVSLNKYKIDVKNCKYDLMIALYLTDYTVKDDMAFTSKAFNYDIPAYEDLYGTIKRPKDPGNNIKDVLLLKNAFIYNTREEILSKIKEYKEEELFNKIEMPLTKVLSDMELTGVLLDKDYLLDAKKDLESKMKVLEKEIYDMAGEEFNIMSPAQLGKVLFEDLKIPYPKKVKDNKYSTSKDILDKIKDDNNVVLKVLEYRGLSKLLSNYVIGLINEIREDGRVHTIFTQTLTRTGRLSSIEPNLQNIPARSDFSRLIRKAFIPKEGASLLSSDYSQIELRVFASMSNAENMIEAFKENKDIHTKTASEIYHVKEEDVTKSMRRNAKAVNFGIIYGISSFGLSDDLGISMKEASNFINNYLDTFPGIREYMKEEVDKAYKEGYVTTLLNRRRVIPELKNKNYIIRQSGERMALNTPVQGTAADILKIAMVNIYNIFKEKNLKTKMVIQIHDELVFEVPDDELEIVKEIVRKEMDSAFTLKVPLKVEINAGKNLYEAK